MKSTFSWSKLLTYSVALLCSTFISSAQIVPNGSFEDLSDPSYILNGRNGIIDLRCKDWSCPHAGTADYFRTDAITSCEVEVPRNHFGVQTPAHGNAYAGIRAYNIDGYAYNGNYAEYITTILKFQNSNQVGKTYRISFQVSLAEFMSDQSLKGLGAVVLNDAQYTLLQTWISSNSANQAFIDLNAVRTLGLAQSPQINFPNAPHAASIQYISNTTGWTEISGYYTLPNLTEGPYHLVIGAFFPLGYTNFYRATDCIDDGSPLQPYDQGREGYYYIDDVKMTEFTPRTDCSCEGVNARVAYQTYEYTCCWRFYVTIPPQLVDACGIMGIRLIPPVGKDLIASGYIPGFIIDENDPRAWRSYTGKPLPPGETEFGVFCITNGVSGMSYPVTVQFLDAAGNVVCSKTLNVECRN